MDSLKALSSEISNINEFTHVTLDPKGKLYITADKITKFYSIYQRVIKSSPLCIAERQGQYVPLIFDFDLKKDIEDGEEAAQQQCNVVKLYTINEIKCIVNIIQECIISNVQIGKNKFTNRHLWCVLLEKECTVTENVIKNGFHLHFPHLFLSQTHLTILMNAIKKSIDDFDFEELPTTLVSSLIDSISTKCWLMYGSSKSKNLKPYLVTKIFNHKQELITEYTCFKKELDVNGNQITPDTVNDNLPYLLRTSPEPHIIEKRILVIKIPETNLIPSIAMKRQDDDSLEYTESNDIVEHVRTLVSMLSQDRADNYNEWWSIGLIIYSISRKYDNMYDSDLFEIWNDFSSQSEKYDENSCIVKWDDFSKLANIQKTIGSLIFMAKQDSPKQANKYLSEYRKSLLSVMHIPSTDYEIAEIILKQHESEYIHGSDGLYKFNLNIWQSVEFPGKEFRSHLITLSQHYKEMRRSWDGDEEENKIIFKCIQQLSKKCENYSTQNGVVKMMFDLISEPCLAEKMNSQPHLIAFKNGIFDLENLHFRGGLPEDYISKQMNVIYNTDLHADHPNIRNLETFLEQLFPDSTLKEYFLYQICEVFMGGNLDKMVMIWTGTGNNGKSALQHIFEKMLGKLTIKFPKSILISEAPRAGGCFPELTRAQGGIRWAVIDELAPNEMINSGMVKYLSGNDSMYARDILQKGKNVVEFEPFFKLVIICNKIPSLLRPDSATWERIFVIPFEAKFIPQNEFDKLPKKERFGYSIADKQRYSNPKNLAILGESLAWYLMQIFIKKRTDNYHIPVPDKVKEATEKYKAQGDAIAYFIKDNFEQTCDATNYVTIPLMYNEFKKWFSETHTHNKLNIDKKEFCQMFMEQAKSSGCKIDSKGQKCYGMLYRIDQEEENNF